MVHPELVVAKVVTMLLGFLIAVQAYRGYRQHDNWVMLYVAVGFAIISLGAIIEGLLFDVIQMDIFRAGAIQTTIVALGMLVILYSLYADAPLGELL